MKVGDKVIFNEDKWRVLDLQSDRALLLRDSFFGGRQFHKDPVNITWEQCTLRQFLNNEYLDSFVNEDRRRIIKTRISNPKNPYFGEEDSADTYDYMFLLSIDEIIKYFGDFRPYNDEWKKDPNKNKRKAKSDNGNFSCWWLRTPGVQNEKYKNIAYINGVGRVMYGGDFVTRHVGVRPIMWVSI